MKLFFYAILFVENCWIIRNFIYMCYNITKKGEWAYEGKTEE